MTQVDFYLLQNQVSQGRLKLTCRVTDKAYGAGKKVFIHTNDTRQSDQLDDLLWTLAQGSFIPHAQCGPGVETSGYPVLIGESKQDEPQADVLISLRQSVPENFNDYKRVIEIVGSDEQEKAEARKRFRFYREQGLEPAAHKIAL